MEVESEEVRPGGEDGGTNGSGGDQVKMRVLTKHQWLKARSEFRKLKRQLFALVKIPTQKSRSGSPRKSQSPDKKGKVENLGPE